MQDSRRHVLAWDVKVKDLFFFAYPEYAGFQNVIVAVHKITREIAVILCEGLKLKDTVCK